MLLLLSLLCGAGASLLYWQGRPTNPGVGDLSTSAIRFEVARPMVGSWWAWRDQAEEGASQGNSFRLRLLVESPTRASSAALVTFDDVIQLRAPTSTAVLSSWTTPVLGGGTWRKALVALPATGWVAQDGHYVQGLLLDFVTREPFWRTENGRTNLQLPQLGATNSCVSLATQGTGSRDCFAGQSRVNADNIFEFNSPVIGKRFEYLYPPSQPGQISWRLEGPLAISASWIAIDREATNQRNLFISAALLGFCTALLPLAFERTRRGTNREASPVNPSRRRSST